MSRSNRQADCRIRDDATSIVPAGTPDWITAELIEQTIRVWQPYDETPLTIDDAIEIIRNAGLLFDALSTRRSGAKISGESQQ
ncbi:hypothetical protein GC176_26825 [bacterium]|nr:hypothetical protein [bacterium]